LNALVTGGSGFLGTALIRALLKANWKVKSISRSAPKLKHPNLEIILADLSQLRELNQAASGTDCVFHCAAIAGIWGSRDLYFKTNVEGTEHVIQACKNQNVPRLVFTSSPSVIFDGHSHRNAKESECDYPKKWLCAYPESKARAEQKVLAAHQSHQLATCSLRPHLIFGPGDPHLIPRILDKARKGRLRIVGNGQNWVDMIHVDNAAHAHLLAEQALREGRAGGEAFFISNGEPIQMWPWIQELLKAAHLPPIDKKISAPFAEKLGGILEWCYTFFKLKGEPPMTRFVAKQLSSDHSYDLTKAKTLLGYQPLISMKEATSELHASLKLN